MADTMMDVVGKVLNHKVGSILAAIIFSIGWWLFIDGVAYGPPADEVGLQYYTMTNGTIGTTEGMPSTLPWYGYIPAFCVTGILILINLVSLDDMGVQQQGMFQTKSYGTIIKIWLFLWITLGCGCVAGSVTIFCVVFPNTWIGIAVMLQPIFVLVAAIIWLLTRRVPTKNDDDFVM